MPNQTPKRKTKRKPGSTTKLIEMQAAGRPSNILVWCALGTVGLAAGLFFTNHRRAGSFIGQMLSSLIMIALYNKLEAAEGNPKK